MTIDERVKEIENVLYEGHFAPDGTFSEKQALRAELRPRLKSVLLEVARDQRHACAEALLECESTHDDAAEWKVIHQAVMNAELQPKRACKD